MFKVDVFVPQGRAFDRQAADRARMQLVDERSEASRFPVASPEDTILAKLEWFRRGGEISERQWSDVLGILRVATADRDYLQHWARELQVADLLARAMEDASK